jgi:hypothetical protein
MKDMEQIEEMLNSYIDGELDERKANEVKRLIGNDEQVRRTFDLLSRYKKLTASVSPVAAPEGFCESVTKQLEREILLADTSVYHHHSAGSRHLIVRRLLTAAAIIVLMGVLSVIVFDIFVPKSDRDKFVNNALNRKQKPQVLYEKPFADAKPAEDAIIAVPPQKTSPIPVVAKLTLVTESPVETDWLIGKALMNTGLFDKTVEIDRKTGFVKYVLSCDRDSLVTLVGELSFIWPNCTDAEFQIGTEQAGKYVTVNNVTAQQVLEICKADNFDRRMRIANDIAIINNAAATDVLRNYFAKQDTGSELFMPDKPVLTSPEKVQQSKSNNSGPKATLTILVIEK